MSGCVAGAGATVVFFDWWKGDAISLLAVFSVGAFGDNNAGDLGLSQM